MAVLSVVSLRMRDGQREQAFEAQRAIKKAVERAGGVYRIYGQIYGSQMGAATGVAEYPGWDGLAKFRSDPELRQLRERITADPPFDLVEMAVYEELTL